MSPSPGVAIRFRVQRYFANHRCEATSYWPFAPMRDSSRRPRACPARPLQHLGDIVAGASLRDENRTSTFVYDIDVPPLVYGYAASCHAVGIWPDMVQCRARIVNDGCVYSLIFSFRRHVRLKESRGLPTCTACSQLGDLGLRDTCVDLREIQREEYRRQSCGQHSSHGLGVCRKIILRVMIVVERLDAAAHDVDMAKALRNGPLPLKQERQRGQGARGDVRHGTCFANPLFDVINTVVDLRVADCKVDAVDRICLIVAQQLQFAFPPLRIPYIEQPIQGGSVPQQTTSFSRYGNLAFLRFHGKDFHAL